MAVSHHAIGDREDANFWFIASVGYWLGAVPTCLAWAFYVTQHGLMTTLFGLGMPTSCASN